MTEKTEKQLNAEADAFMKLVSDNSPSALTGAHIIRLCGELVCHYSPHRIAAMHVTNRIAQIVDEYYEAECPCDACVAERNAKLN